MINYYGFIPLIAFIISGFIWAFIFAKKSNKINNAFLIFTADLLIWEFTAYLCISVLPETLIVAAFRIASLSWFLIGILFLNFVFAFLDRKRNLLFLFFSFMVVITIVLSLNTDLVVEKLIYKFYGPGFLPGSLYTSAILVVVVIPIIYAVVLLVKAYISSKNINLRASLLLLIIGITFSTSLSSIINVFLPEFFNIYILDPYASTSSLVILFFVFRAILKYNFLSLTEEEVTINLLENLNDGVVLTDNFNRVIQINKSAKIFFSISITTNLSGISINSLLNNYELKFEDDSDSFFIELNEKNNFVTSENSIKNDKEKIIDRRVFSINYSKVFKNKKSKGKIFIVRDVTLSFTAEEVLKKSKVDLEKDITDRTIELTQTKNYIELIYNTISESIIIIDMKDKILNVNDSFNKLYKFTKDEILGSDISTLFTDDEFYKIQLQLKALELENAISFDSYNSKEDGTMFPVSISAVKMQKESNLGKTFQIILSIFDMTEKKIIEAKMKDSRNKSRMVIQNINEAIFVVQDNNIKYFINAKLHQILGYSLDELVSFPFLDFIHPEEKQQIEKTLEKISEKADEVRLDEKITEAVVFRMINSSGNVRWVEINIILKRWNSEPAFLMYLSDITERKIAEMSLVENENQFRAFIDQANDFIIIKDLEGKYLKANEKFCDLLKLKEEDIIGKGPKDLGYSEKFIAKTNKIDEEVIKHKKIIIENHTAYKSSSDGVTWLEVTTFPILDNRNEVKYVGILSRDITAQKSWEDEISSQHEQLKNAHGELKKSHEIIGKQEKLASLGTMAAGIAHEINNPAQVVKFSMQSLDMNIKDVSEVIQFINNLRKEKDTNIILNKFNELNELMDDLDIDVALEELDKTSEENIKSIERIEHIIKSTKRLVYNDLEYSDCDINEIIKDSLTLVDNSVKYNVNVTKSLGSDIPSMTGISSELTQVIINLVNNSKDSIIEKGLSLGDAVIFIATSYNKNSNNIEIVIEDNGAGISKDVLNKIYDPFFTTKKVGQGTGLGLNIVHKIIKAHNGEIKVKSNLGVGTKFKLSIPKDKQ